MNWVQLLLLQLAGDDKNHQKHRDLCDFQLKIGFSDRGKRRKK
jgi:hypothetical protein